MLKVVGASWAQTKISSLILAMVVAVGVVVIILGEVGRMEQDGNYSATVYWSEGSGFRIEYWGEGNNLEETPHGAARAVYSPNMDTTGWARFEVQTHQDYPDWVQAYSAGLLEGSLSWQLVYWHWQNTVRDVCERQEQLCDNIKRFVVHNSEWVRIKAKNNMHKDPFWHQVNLYYTQLEGLEMGWREGVERSRQEIDIPHDDFLWMAVIIDVVDLERKVGSTEKKAEPQRSVPATFSAALFKLLPETSQLLVAHNAGARYQSMLRMMKRYHLSYHLLSRSSYELVPGSDVVFSSYPGSLSSQDDFYVVASSSQDSHKMVVAGTAIDNFNTALWSGEDTDKVLAAARVMVANRLATDGKSWARNMEKYNSGTGNKQWVVADYGRLARAHLDSAAVKADTLHVLEEQVTGPTALERDGPSTHTLRLEARRAGDAPSVRLLEVRAEDGEPSGGVHDTQLVLQMSRLFDHGDASVQSQPREHSEESLESRETSDGAEPFHDVGSSVVNDAEWIDGSFVRSHRKFSSYRGVLWVVEQLPGITHYMDKSHSLLKSGYWASFGLPYFKEISDASDTTKMQGRKGDKYSHQDNPKAVMFRKKQVNVTDVSSLLDVMHSVDASHSASTQHSLAGRGDLVPGVPIGTIDTKIFSGSPSRPSSIHAIAGPPYTLHTTDRDVAVHVEPFQWSKSSFSKTTPHFGQPDTWKFPMFTIQWAWNTQMGTKIS